MIFLAFETILRHMFFIGTIKQVLKCTIITIINIYGPVRVPLNDQHHLPDVFVEISNLRFYNFLLKARCSFDKEEWREANIQSIKYRRLTYR